MPCRVPGRAEIPRGGHDAMQESIARQIILCLFALLIPAFALAAPVPPGNGDDLQGLAATIRDPQQREVLLKRLDTLIEARSAAQPAPATPPAAAPAAASNRGWSRTSRSAPCACA